MVNEYNEHVLKRMDEIVSDLANASLSDVEGLLNYYNGDELLIDGVPHFPFNDPVVASKINERYKELTGKDHERFIEEAPVIIYELLENRDFLESLGAYDTDYFNEIESIMEQINNRVNSVDNDGSLDSESLKRI